MKAKLVKKLSILSKSMSVPVALPLRDVLLGAAVCVLGGMVTGMLMSPRKNVTIGSNNSGNHYYGSDAEETNEADAEETE